MIEKISRAREASAPPRAVIAPDSFKNSLTAVEAARAIARGLCRAGDFDLALVPIADGGEGTVEALCLAANGERLCARVQDPLGRAVEAKYAKLARAYVVETAEASGFSLLREDERDALRASTYGTGQLIRRAIESGAKRVVLGLGGSATNDGGAGMAMALGYRLLDDSGAQIGPGGAELLRLRSIRRPENDLLNHVEFRAACDVTNTLCGENGASQIYGPQKGASPADVLLLDRALSHFAEIIKRDLGADILNTPGSGAAGGLGGGAIAFLNARLEPGFDLVARETRLAEKISGAFLVVTGEGRTDAQTLRGKVPFGVGQIAGRYKIPAFCLSGSLAPGFEALYESGITACFSIADGPMPLAWALERAPSLLEEAAFAVGRSALAFAGRA